MNLWFMQDFHWAELSNLCCKLSFWVFVRSPLGIMISFHCELTMLVWMPFEFSALIECHSWADGNSSVKHSEVFVSWRVPETGCEESPRIPFSNFSDSGLAIPAHSRILQLTSSLCSIQTADSSHFRQNYKFWLNPKSKPNSIPESQKEEKNLRIWFFPRDKLAKIKLPGSFLIFWPLSAIA